MLLALLCLTNARLVFRHSSTAGYVAAYDSYCGKWLMECPIGDLARVLFYAHGPNTLSKDVYPARFQQRVDKCLQMLAGVIESHSSTTFKCAFPERKLSGKWVLRYTPKGLTVHERHLYDVIGGKLDEVDFLVMKSTNKIESSEEMTILRLFNGDPDVSDGKNQPFSMKPWINFLGRIYHGRSIKGYVISSFPLQGKAVRIVTEIATIYSGGLISAFDETSFWRDTTPLTLTSRAQILDPMTVIALVKFFVLEWSTELDYEMYHDFPLEMYLG
ncbi:unnamed protein product [Penicillium glandicola]